MPPIKKIPPKYWMYGVAVVSPLLKFAGQSLVSYFSTSPRTCPECSYVTVAEVGRRKTEKRTVHYWRCSACASRYRSNGVQAPLTRPSDTDWAQHVRIGLDCGLTEAEVERIKEGPDTSEWSEWDQALLQATDELTLDAFISDATWSRLDPLTEKQRMDLVMTVAQYTQVSMMLNTFGVQLDDDLTPDPDLNKKG